MSNGHGRGVHVNERGETLWWYSGDCPLHVTKGEPASEEVAAIDAANEHRSLCLLCRASFPVGIAGLCASCLYDFYPNDDTQPTTSEAHAA